MDNASHAQDKQGDANQGSPKEHKQEEGHEGWKSIFGRFFSDFHRGGYTANSVVTVVFVLIGPLLVYLFMQTPKGMVIAFGVGLTIAVWFVVFGVVRVIDRKTYDPNMLQPANDLTPELWIPPPNLFPSNLQKRATTPDKSEMLIFIGGVAVSTSQSEFVLMRLYGKDVLKIGRTPSGVHISSDIWDSEGKILATIEKNRFRVNPNNTLPLMRPDPHTLVVEDETKTKVLYVRFLNESAIRITGRFRAAGGIYPVIVDEHEISFGPLRIRRGIVLHAKGREAFFEWPGKLHGTRLLGASDRLPTGAVGIPVANNGVVSFIIRTPTGESYSVFQAGSSELLPGEVLVPALEFGFFP